MDDRLRRSSGLGDQLEAYGRVVDFEAFRPDLEKALAYRSGVHDGQPPYSLVMRLKVLVIQIANNLSDERTEFLINVRLSFMRFPGLGLDLTVEGNAIAAPIHIDMGGWTQALQRYDEEGGCSVMVVNDNSGSTTRIAA